MTSFLDLLFADALGEPVPGWIETRYIEDRRSITPPIREWWESSRDLATALPAIAERAQQDGRAVFFGVLPRATRGDGTASSAAPGMVAWCDVDFKEVEEPEARRRIAAFPVTPSVVVHSGRGLHLYWLMKEPTDPATLREISKRAAHALGGDRCFDAARILRMPGTRNVKACWLDDAYRFEPSAPVVTIEYADAAMRYNPDDFDVLPEAPADTERRDTVLPTNAAIPAEVSARVAQLIKDRNRLALYWRSEGKESGDTSGSGYDMSFACSLILHGVTEPAELAAAVAARPRVAGGKARSKREVWRTVDHALDVIRPSTQEQERTAPDGGQPYAEEPAPHDDGGALESLASFIDRIKAAEKDHVALKKIELELMHPSLIADLAAGDEDQVSLALAGLSLRGFTKHVERIAKAVNKARALLEGARQHVADKARQEAQKKRDERMIEEEWPMTRSGPHPGVVAALSVRKGAPAICHANLILILKMDPRWAGRFRINRMGDMLEFDGALVDSEARLVSDITVWLSRHYDIHFRIEDVKAAVYATALSNEYHPVREYLCELPIWDGVDRVEVLLTEVLHVNDGATSQEMDLYRKFLRRFLISAVARVMNPGCKVDTALIFTGEQGAKKSSFFQALASPAWFGDSPIPIGDKNAPIQLRSTWLYECAEMESLNKRTADEVKQFLSTSRDLFRNIYERNARHWGRHSVICGSTNKPEFLSDPSGSRRFWPIPVPDHAVIDIERLLTIREAVWAQALALYRQAVEQKKVGTPDESCRWWFERDEDRDRAEQAQRFEVTDVWDGLVMEFVVRMMGKFTIADILHEGLSMQKERMDQAAKNRVGAILRRHGWKSKRARSEHDKGKFIDVWVREAADDGPPPPNVASVPTWRDVPINDDGVPF